ncbi:MAG: hypothetical protein AABY84_08875 [Candidatus Firestonebacteria bacterium]
MKEYKTYKGILEVTGIIIGGGGLILFISGVQDFISASYIKEEILKREQSFLNNFKFTFSKDSTCLNYSFKF